MQTKSPLLLNWWRFENSFKSKVPRAAAFILKNKNVSIRTPRVETTPPLLLVQSLASCRLQQLFPRVSYKAQRKSCSHLLFPGPFVQRIAGEVEVLGNVESELAAFSFVIGESRARIEHRRRGLVGWAQTSHTKLSEAGSALREPVLADKAEDRAHLAINLSERVGMGRVNLACSRLPIPPALPSQSRPAGFFASLSFHHLRARNRQVLVGLTFPSQQLVRARSFFTSPGRWSSGCSKCRWIESFCRVIC